MPKLKNRESILRAVSLATLVAGLLTLSSTILALSHAHHIRIVIADAHVTVIAGLSLIYLASLLRRGKYNAWLISLGVYGILIARNLRHYIIDFRSDDHLLVAILNISLPVAALLALVIFKDYFKVRSELRSFTLALRRAALVLAVAFLYGVIGFQFFDDKDFHQEVSIPTSIHYTLDQSGFTTNNQPIAYTHRGQFFVDSLAAISLTSLFYVAVSLFAPVRFRLSHSNHDRDDAEIIIKQHSKTSEDFFKLWPAEKSYFFNEKRSAFIAYKVSRNVALAVGDPVGPSGAIDELLAGFLEYCWLNDWAVAFIHAEKRTLNTYKTYDFSVQKIGEEALIDVSHFKNTVAVNKYFRHISNRFTKLGYSFEVLSPPHNLLLTSDLKTISDQWLEAPGREERKFMMGYFSEAYIQKCKLAIVRDHTGKAMAFLNEVPSPVVDEANFDFLRHGLNSPGNINDYLMLNYLTYLHSQGIKSLNMGLCPLAGLTDKDENKSLISSVLAFVYANAGRFYSFKGLTRFKAKYEPEWQDRYIVYRGGVAGFSRVLNALLKAMTI